MRKIDRQVIVPALVGAALCGEATCNRAWVAFHIFTVQPGQEHWWCACGDAERREVEEMLE